MFLGIRAHFWGAFGLCRLVGVVLLYGSVWMKAPCCNEPLLEHPQSDKPKGHISPRMNRIFKSEKKKKRRRRKRKKKKEEEEED